MKKQQKNILIIVAILIAIFLIAYAKPFSISPVQTASGRSDMQILSVSTLVINGEQRIRINAVASGGAELLDINWNTSELNQELAEANSPLKATLPITGRFTIDEQTKEFPYVPTGSGIYSTVREDSAGLEWSCNEDACNSIKEDDEDYLASRFGLINCYCLFGGDKYDVGRWESVIKGNYRVTFTIDGEGSATLDRNNQREGNNSIQLGSRTRIEFVGFLDSFDEINEPSLTPYLYQNDIRLIEPTSFAFIVDAMSTTQRAYLNSMPPHPSYISQYNLYLQNALTDKTDIYVRGLIDYISSISKDRSGLKITLKYPDQYLMFTIDLNAQSVGIIEQSGQPSIVKPCPFCNFDANTEGNLTMRVGNIGNDAGGFRVAFENCDKMSAYVVGGNNLGTFDVGQQKTFGVRVQGTTQNQAGETGTCLMKVYDFHDPNKYDTCSFSCDINYNPGGLCSPVGSLICNQDYSKILECKSSGYREIKESCRYRCEYGPDGAYCTDSGGGGGGECKWWDIVCWIKSIFGGLWDVLTIVKYFLIAIVSIFSIFFSRDFIQGLLKPSKENRMISWVLGLLLGVAVAVILYSLLVKYFWTSLIVTAIILIIIKFASGFLGGRK